MEKKKAVIAMSGGVDSSVAASLMQKAGYECIGVTMKLFGTDDIAVEDGGAGRGREAGPGAAAAIHGSAAGEAVSVTPGAAPAARVHHGCCALSDVEDARAVAFRLGMPHYVLNFAAEFKEKVIANFIETYGKGETPNPCIECNRCLKFESLLLRTEQLGFDRLVTGHYARAGKSGGRFLLKKAVDARKDQSYVLYMMTQAQLERTLFPLGSLTKPEVRDIAAQGGFANAEKHDSQDICFVPERDYARFIEAYTGRPAPEGDIIDAAGNVLGRHKGIIRYTIGQRRGLGLAFNAPRYVAAKSAADNTVTVGTEADLYSASLVADRINLIACESLDAPLRVTVKTRYLQKEQAAVAEQIAGDKVRIVFDEPQRAITPGQAAVMYDGDVVVGGGTIVGN